MIPSVNLTASTTLNLSSSVSEGLVECNMQYVRRVLVSTLCSDQVGGWMDGGVRNQRNLLIPEFTTKRDQVRKQSYTGSRSM